MFEPLVTPVAMYTLGGTVAAGHFFRWSYEYYQG